MPNLKKDKFDAIRLAGTYMSNWIYNKEQSESDPYTKGVMKEMVTQWDAAIRESKESK